MPAYHGKDIRILISTSGTGVPTPLVGATGWSIDRSTDRAESTAGGDANKTYVQGFADVQIKFDGIWNDTENKLIAASNSPNGIQAYLYPAFTGAAGKYVAGPVWLDVSYDANTGGPVKYSGTMAANGAMTFNL